MWGVGTKFLLFIKFLIFTQMSVYQLELAQNVSQA